MKTNTLRCLRTLVAIALVGANPVSTWAGNARFLYANGSINSSTAALDVSFKEVGLGNTYITYILTAGQTTITYQCFTRSDNKPQGEPNSISTSNDSQYFDIKPRNGQITATVSLVPQPGDAGCQGAGLKLCIVAASYQSVTFTDDTYKVPATLVPNNFSATFTKPVCIL